MTPVVGLRRMTHHWGYASAAVSAALFGLGSVAAKLLLEGVHPLWVASLSYLLSGVLLLTLRVSSRGRVRRLYEFLGIPQHGFPSLHRSDLVLLIPVVLFGAVLGPLAYMTGLSRTAASVASVLSISENAFTVLLAASLLGERLRPAEVPPIAATLVGVTYLSWASSGGRGPGDALGNLLIVAACLLWSFDNLLSKVLSLRGDPFEVAGLKSLLGGGALAAVAASAGVVLTLGPVQALLLASLGFVSIGLSMSLYISALRHIGAGRTSVIFASSALFGVVAARAILGETLTVGQWLACLLTLSGVAGLYGVGGRG